MAKENSKEALARLMADPMWRISHLYKIIIKGDDDDEEGLVVQFKPNRAQRRFIGRLHHRNIILKARQLGFTTLIAIVWLDHALFNANSRCGIIAHDRDAAKVIFRDKVKFAYENLPAELRAAMPLKADNADELLFAHNNSSVRVATSMRSGTIHRLHISEFGKICAKYPDKAKEVITGSIPAVPLRGITIIESTAEGAEGEFHDMTQRAISIQEQGKTLTEKDWRFHFFPWWDEQQYRMTPGGAVITTKDEEYFARIEAEMNTTIDAGQREWYVATRDTDFSGNDERMWQEYPSTPKEAFQVSSEGCYYNKQITAARKQGRVLSIPVLNVPVNTFWDIGNSDGVAIWFHQQVGMEDRFIAYYEAHGEDLKHYARYLQDTGYVWNKHFFPHDANHKRLSDTNKSTKEMMEDLGLRNIEIVPVISDIGTGINITRDAFPSAYFDEAGCKQGFAHLENYKKTWNERDGRWSDTPKKDATSEGADAFRQWAQAKSGGMITPAGSWGGALNYPRLGNA
jgi:hypothetical protein